MSARFGSLIFFYSSSSCNKLINRNSRFSLLFPCLLTNQNEYSSSPRSIHSFSTENIREEKVPNAEISNSNVDPELLFKFSESNETSSSDEFSFNELVTCRVTTRQFNKHSNSDVNVNYKLLKLTPGEIFRLRYFSVFHEHIRKLTSLTYYNIRYDFKRPSLYDYITLKVDLI